MAKKIYVGALENPAQLEDGVTRVEYIETTKGRFGISAFYPSYTGGSIAYRFYLDVEILTSATSGTYWLFGCGASSGSTSQWGLYWENGYFKAAHGTSRTTIMKQTNIKGRYQIEFSDTIVKINDISITRTAANYTASSNICSLLHNAQGTNTRYLSAKLYSCTIYQNDKLLYQYIPVIWTGTLDTNGNPGGFFYNLLTRQMLASVNGSTQSLFSGGPVHTPSKYVAHAVKSVYIGIAGEIPPTDEPEDDPSGDITQEINIDNTNINTYFDVSHGTYSFQWDASKNAFVSNNTRVNGSSAITTLIAKQKMSLSFDYSYSSEVDYDELIIQINNTMVITESGIGTASYTKEIAANDMITFQYVKGNTTSSNDDQCSFYNMKIITTIASEGEHTPPEGTPEEPEITPSIKGVARRVKKAYVGIGGKARPFWSLSSVTKYGNLDSLNTSGACWGMGSASTSTKAIFINGFGYTGGAAKNSIYYYTPSLTRGTTTTPTARIWPAVAATDTTLITAGGLSSATVSSPMSSVTAHNVSTLTSYSTLTSLPTAVSAAAAVALDGNIIIAGGTTASSFTTNVVSYNAAGTRSSLTPLSAISNGRNGVATDQYAIFNGGVATAALEIYTFTGTKITMSPSTHRLRAWPGAARAGDYVVFASGGTTTTSTAGDGTVEAISRDLVVSYAQSMPSGRLEMASTSLGPFALFSGGISQIGISTTPQAFSDTYAYDSSLAQSVLGKGHVQYSGSGASTGNYAIIAGGVTSGGASSANPAVTAYQLSE